MPQDVDIPVRSAQLVISVFGTIPAIEKFFHLVMAITEGEAIWMVRSPGTLDIHPSTLTSSRYHFEQTHGKQVTSKTAAK
jgi:hypothetical protein